MDSTESLTASPLFTQRSRPQRRIIAIALFLFAVGAIALRECL